MLSIVSGTVDSTVTPPSEDPSSSVMLRRIRKPATTATTASTMLRVEPMGDPPIPGGATAAGAGCDPTGALGSSLVMRALPLRSRWTPFRRAELCGPADAAA